jgi:GWxTD domain-containing protein
METSLKTKMRIDRMCLGSILAALLLASSVFILSAQVKPRDLPERYRIWLEEEVLYIITPIEREVFLKLQSDRERDLFIESFWRQRDPTPGTEKNEFREEHLRRIAHANRYFRGSGRPGWKTDRGKVYIILGEPMSIREFHGSDTYYPAVLWSYQGVNAPGLPEAFNLLFFQKGRIGDHVLYQPTTDGPWSLIPNFKGNPGEYNEAYAYLELLEPELAQASISLIPGESVRNLPSLASAAILQNLDASAFRKIEDRYAQKFIEYKDLVEVEYSANYIDSETQVEVIYDHSGIPFIHYSIQPRNISVGRYENTISTDLEFNGILTDLEGHTVYQFEKKVPLKFSPDQFEKLRQRPFSFTDLVPVIPGEYKLSVLMKNTVSKEFTSLEQTVRIPADSTALRITPLLLSFNTARAPAAAGYRPFVVGDVQLYSQPGNTFLRQDKLHVYFQILNLPDDLKKNGILKYDIDKEGEARLSVSHPLSKYPDSLDYLEIFPLADFPPGYYRISVTLQDGQENELLRQESPFEISPLDYIPRPWVHTQSWMGEASPSQVERVLGKELANKGNYDQALPRLEKAFHENPAKSDYAIDLARVYLSLNRAREALAVLQPFSGSAKTDYDLSLLFARLHQALGQYAEALRYLEGALDSFGLNVSLLNEIGECHLRLGNRSDALAAWKKSLEIDPNQPRIRELIAKIQE